MVTIATWNVNSVTARLPQLMRWLERVRPNVLCLQETKVVDDKFPVKEFEDAGFTVEIFGEKSYNGVAIVSDKPVKDVSRGFVGDDDCAQKRLISCTYDGIKIIDVYMPNGQEIGCDKYSYKLQWMSALRDILEKGYKSQDQVLVCGDFNVAVDDIDVWDPKAMKGQILVSQPERDALESIRKWGFIDLYRKHHSGSGLYSWWDYRTPLARNMGLRIDHIWATAPLADRCQSIYIDKDARKEERPSDHAPVIAEFAPA